MKATQCMLASAEDQTDVNLKEALPHTIEEWHLDASKMVALTADNARNMCLACKLLGWWHLNCFGQNLRSFGFHTWYPCGKILMF